MGVEEDRDIDNDGAVVDEEDNGEEDGGLEEGRRAEGGANDLVLVDEEEDKR